MRKIVLLGFFMMFSIHLFSQKQKVYQEIVRDSTSEINTYSDAKELLDLFYQKQFELEDLKTLISHRMFEVTPYEKFEEMLQAKNAMCGAFVKKEIVSEDISENKLIAIYELKVEYQKTKTIEKVYLVKEAISDKFRVAKYLLQEDL